MPELTNKISKYNTNPGGPVVLISQEIKYAFPFSFAYLAGYLRQHGEDVRVLFRPSWGGYDKLVKEIIDMKPLVVGFGSLYTELKAITELISKLNEAGRDFPIVIGGQMVSPIPEFAVKTTGADLGVIGEGEITLLKLVKALREKKDLYGIGGLAIRNGSEINLTGPGDFIEDLSKLPPIPYDLFPEDDWLPIGRYYADKAQPHWRFNDRVIPIHGGRGCPFHCNFCYQHSKFRYRSISDMMQEAKEQLERFNGNILDFADDLVIFSVQRARELTEALSNFKKPVEYSVSARFDLLERIDDNLLRDMKKTGCRIMGLGIESGSQRILDLMDKKITVDQIKNGLNRLKNAGILPTVSIMVGQVSETVEDVQASINLMKDTLENDKNLEHAFSVTTPFPSSPLYLLALEKGYIHSHEDFYERYDFSRGKSFQLIVNFSEMSDRELLSRYSNIKSAYRKTQRKVLGFRIILIESIRTFLYRVNYVLFKILLPALPKVKFALFDSTGKVYRCVYDSIQEKLDHLRLRLRGIT